jgi:hypothetical protein
MHLSRSVSGVRTASVQAVFFLLMALGCLRLAAATPDCTPPAGGLVGWWPGDTNGTDVTGKNPAVLTNGVGVVAGKVGTAFSFDGIDDYVVIPASASLNVGTNGGFTVEAWVKPANLNGPMPVFEWRWLPGVEVGVHLWLNQSSQGDVYANVIEAVAQSHTVVSGGGVVQAGTYQHIALTYDRLSGAANIYVNGTNVASANLGSFIPKTATDLLIGKRIDSGSGYVFSGQIDEPSVYSRALLHSEIQAIYSAGTSGKCAPEMTSLVEQDFSGDFSIASNPNGNWSYGSKPTLNGNLSLMTTKGAVSGNSGGQVEYWQVAPSVEPTIFHNSNAVPVTFTGGHVSPGETYMYSGSNGESNKFGVVRYTVPVSGDYQIVASGRPIYDSAAAGQGDTDFHLIRNGVEFFGQNVAAMEQVAFSNTVALAGGDVVDLMLGPGLDGLGGYAGSGLKIDLFLQQISFSLVAPSIAVQPVGSTNEIGAAATLSVTASGSSPLTYQWVKGAGTILGATATSLTLSNLQTSDSGDYLVIVSNTSGSVTSSVASVLVNLGSGVVNGLSSAFSIASNPNGYWSYGFRATLGGDLSLMTTKGAVPGNSGGLVEYWQVAPSVEPTIFHNSNTVPVTFTGGHVDPGETYMYSGSNGQTNKFGVVRFRVPTAGQYRVEASGRPVYDSAGAGQGDTDFHIVRNEIELFGRNVAAMEQTAFSNIVDLAAGDLVELVVGPGQDGLGSVAGSALKLECSITLVSTTPAAPFIVVQPIGSTNDIGASTSLNVTAFSTSPFSYRWMKGSDLVAGATNASLSLSNLQVLDSGRLGDQHCGGCLGQAKRRFGRSVDLQGDAGRDFIRTLVRGASPPIGLWVQSVRAVSDLDQRDPFPAPRSARGRVQRDDFRFPGESVDHDKPTQWIEQHLRRQHRGGRKTSLQRGCDALERLRRRGRWNQGVRHQIGTFPTVPIRPGFGEPSL